MDEALTRLDAHLCDLGEVTIRDGLHVFGCAPAGFEACAAGEREGLLKAVDGRFVVPGPSGSPSRGQTNVLPTGRNLATLDPRAIPTRAATELGSRAAAEVVRRHLQDRRDRDDAGATDARHPHEQLARNPCDRLRQRDRRLARRRRLRALPSPPRGVTSRNEGQSPFRHVKSWLQED